MRRMLAILMLGGLLAMNLPTYAQTPPLFSGAELQPGDRGLWSIIRPVATDGRDTYNYCKNPSFETSLDGVVDLMGTSIINQRSATSYSGAGPEPNEPGAYSGVYYLEALGFTSRTLSFSSYVSTYVGQITYSMYVRHRTYRTFDVNFTLRVNGFTRATARIFGPHLDWTRVELAPVSVLPGDVVDFEISSGNQFGVLDLDAIQFENSSGATTYFDGSTGLSSYWVGVPHASYSVRLFDDRLAGEVVNLNRYLHIIADTGAGMPRLDAQATPYAVLDGAQYDGTRATNRIITLGGRIKGRDYQEIERNRQALVDLVRRDVTANDAPFYLHYQPLDDNGRELGEALVIPAVYVGGLERNSTNRYGEDVTIQFRADQPLWERLRTDAAVIDANNILANSQGVIYRPVREQWQAMAGGLVGLPEVGLAFARLLTGQIVVGGAFTSAGGTPNTQNIALYNVEADTWDSIGDANGMVRALFILSNGDLVAGGDFTLIGGVAANRIARYNFTTNTWTAFGAGANATVRVINRDIYGRLYAGGDFTSIGGVAANRIAYYDGAAWNAMGTGANNIVYAIQTDTVGNVFLGGAFTSLGGVASTARVGRWNANTLNYASMNGGLIAGTVYALKLDPSRNYLYIGGDGLQYNVAVAASDILRYNGQGYAYLGGAPVAATNVQSLELVGRSLWVGFNGAPTSIPGIVGSPQATIYEWTGSDWRVGDIVIGAAQVNAIYSDARGVLVGHGGGTNRPYAPVNDVEVAAGAATPPVFRVENQSTSTRRTLLFIENVTAGARLDFRLALLAQETITIDLSDPQGRVTSNLRGVLGGAYLPGSTVATFRLEPKQVNAIRAFAETTDVVVTMVWNGREWSVSGVMR